MSLSVWSAISRLRQAGEPLAWWKHSLGADFIAFRPFLIPCVGLAGETYPCPDTGLPLQIRETGGCYRAFPFGDAAEDTADRELTWDDVQAWRVNHDGLRQGLARAFGLTPGPDCGDCGDLQFTGFCDRKSDRKRVYLALADGNDAAVRIAADTGRTPEAGCLLFPEHHTGAEQVLKARGVSLISLADCCTLEAGYFKGGCGDACRALTPDITNIELKTHLDRRLDTVGHHVGGIEMENVVLKQNLARVLVSMGQRVEPEFLQWLFVILGQGSVSAAARYLRIKGSTFDQRLKGYVKRGGLYRILYSMLGVRRKGVGQKSIEEFNELFAKHQNGLKGADLGVWQELLNGLEDLNEENWQGMRDELIGIVKETMAEE